MDCAYIALYNNADFLMYVVIMDDIVRGCCAFCN